jgi:hypothetical protein
MSSPEETQLTDTLRDLVSALPSALPFTLSSADVAAIVRCARRRRRRRLVFRGLASVTAVGIAAAVAFVSVTARTDSNMPGTARIVGYVRKQIETAPNPADSLLKVTQTGNDGNDPSSVVTIWTDPVTGNTMLLSGSGQGRVAYWEHDYYKNRVLNEAGTQVNYGSGTWWTDDVLIGGPVSGPVPSGPVGGGYFTPAMVKALLAQPGWKIAGYPVIDGDSTVEISFSKDGLTSDIWADSHTYQVVRTLRKFPNLPVMTQNYYWVSRSAAMTTLVNHPKIPAGFKQVQGELS